MPHRYGTVQYLHICSNSQRNRREYTKISRFATKFQHRM